MNIDEIVLRLVTSSGAVPLSHRFSIAQKHEQKRLMRVNIVFGLRRHRRLCRISAIGSPLEHPPDHAQVAELPE